VSTRTQFIGGTGNWRANINGVSADYTAIRNWSLRSGAFFSPEDVKAGRKVAVLGATVVANLFPDGDPIGAQVQIGHVPFTVLGVMAAKGQNAVGQDKDDGGLRPCPKGQGRLTGKERSVQIFAT